MADAPFSADSASQCTEIMGLPSAAAADSVSMLLSLPEELKLRVLRRCSPRGLLRLEATCAALRELLAPCSVKAQQLWQQLLHEIWLRNPLCTGQYGAQRWWLCRTTSALGPSMELAMPWRVCGDTPHCKLLRQLSYRESFKACLLDRQRSYITDEELITLKWSVDFSGMAAYLPLADNLRTASPKVSARDGDIGECSGGGMPATFHRDGCYEDGVLFSRGSQRCKWIHNPSVLSNGLPPGQGTRRNDTLALFPAAAEGSRHLKVRTAFYLHFAWLWNARATRCDATGTAHMYDRQ